MICIPYKAQAYNHFRISYIEYLILICIIRIKRNIKNSLKVWKEFVTVPTFPKMNDKKVYFVIKCLREFDNKIQKT